MPTYLSDQPDIVSDVLDLRRRLSILENNPSTGGGGSSGTVVVSGGGGTIPPGGVTYAQLNSDVTTTFDSRYVNVTGDTMSGSLAIGGTLSVTSSTTLSGSLDVGTNATIAGNLVVHGAGFTFDGTNAVMEIGAVGTSNVPKIDFHSSISSTDYDVRLSSSGGTSTTSRGDFLVNAGTMTLTTSGATHATNAFSVSTGTVLISDGNLIVDSGSGGGVTVVTLAGMTGGLNFIQPNDTRAGSIGFGVGTGTTADAGELNYVAGTHNHHGIATFFDAVTHTGTVAINNGIVTTVKGTSEDTYFAWDTSSRLGFVKKTATMPKLAYANGTFAITQYVGQTTITATNTQTDRLTIDVSGLVNIPGPVTLGGTLGVTGVTTLTAALAINGGISTKDVITGGGGSGVGNLAGNTVDTYNLKDGSVTSQKMSAGAIASANVPDGTANNGRDRLLRFVTSSASSQDEAGQNLDNLRTPAVTGVDRIIDGQAYGGWAIRVDHTTYAGSNGDNIMFGPFYGSDTNDFTGSPGLAAGQYRATVYVKVSDSDPTLPVIGLDAHCATAGVVTNDGVLYTFSPSDLASFYSGCSFPVYIGADTRATDGLQIRAYYYTTDAVDVRISHITLEPWSGLSKGEVDTVYIKDASITSAKIHDLEADKITTGTLYADVTQAGTIRTGPDTDARVVLNSGGFYAYTNASFQSVAITNLGDVTITGTINATDGTFTGLITGGQFRGGIFETSGTNVSTVRFDTDGIKAWDAGGVNTVNLSTDGSLYATNVNLTGVINATAGNFTGLITGGTFRGGTFETSGSASGTAYPDATLFPGTGTYPGESTSGGGGGISAVRFDITGIKAWDGTGTNTFNLSATTGALTATSVTLTGTINATGGTFSGAITATSMTLTGGVFSSTSITASTIDATNNINAGSLTSGTLSTARISVAAGFGDNQILNGGFEDATALANWTPNYETTGAASTWAIGTSNVYAGANRAQIALATNAGNALASSSVPVSAGETYSIQGRIRAEGAAPTTGPFYVRVLFGTAKDFARGSLVSSTPTHTTITPGTPGGDFAGFSDLISGYTIAANTYVFVDGTVTAPTGATWMRVALYAWANTTGAWTGVLDGWTVRKQLTGTTIADGAITTRTMTAGSINGDRIQAGTITASAIGTGTLDASTLITVGSGTARIEIDGRTATRGIRLFNGSGGTTVSLDATNGNATFTGTINATNGTFTGTINNTAGTLSGGIITGASITGSTLKTASSGTRVELGTGTIDAVRFFNGSATNPSRVASFADDGTNTGIVLFDGSGGSALQLSTGLVVLQTGGGAGGGSILLSGGISVATTGFFVGPNTNQSNNTNIQIGGGNNVSGAAYYAGSHNFYNGYLQGNSGVYDRGNLVYSGANQPPYPVLSVNGQTGNVSINTSPSGQYAGNAYLQDAVLYIRSSGDTNHELCYGLSGRDGPDLKGFSHVGFINAQYSSSVNSMRVDGSANMYVGGSGNFNQSITASKVGIVPATYGLTTLKQMKPVKYKKRLPHEVGADLAEHELTDQRHYLGFAAEDIEKAVPEAVAYDENGKLWGYASNMLIPVLVKAVQELTEKVEALEAAKKKP